jgi:hypothetical protein
MARQRFQAGIGGTLRLVPAEARLFGRPSAATITIRSTLGTDLPTPVTDSAATADAVDTTLSTAAAQGDRQLVLASVVGIQPGRHYLITGQDGEHLEVEADGVNGTTRAVLLVEPLARDLAAGDAFQGLEVSYLLSGAQCPMPPPGLLTAQALLELEVNAESPSYGRLFRAAWTYTVAGTQYTADQLYEVRRRLLKPTLTADQVQRRLPADWRDLVLGGPRAIERVIGDAWDDLLDELAAKGYDPDRIMDADRLRRPHRSQVLVDLSASWLGDTWIAWRKERIAEADQDLQDALASGDWYDRAEDAVQAPSEAKWPATRITR